MKHLIINLPYFKQGDDLSSCFKGGKTNEEALGEHAKLLKSAAEQLLKIKKIINGHEVKIQADTHYIGIYGEDEVMNKLVKLGLADEDDYDEDNDDDEDDDDDDDDD